MSSLAPKSGDKYTYNDYLQWPQDERWEIIQGVPYMMSPAPSTEHQSISAQLVAQLVQFAGNKPCRVFHAPFDVRLPRADEQDNEIDTVVQPDICIVCDASKLDERGCKGAPDMVVEIISLATAKKDLSEKFNLYEKSGVKAYWVVFPKEKAVEVYQLIQEGVYKKSGTYFAGDIVQCEIFRGLQIDLEKVFA